MPTFSDTLATHERVDVIIKRLANIKRTESTLAAERFRLLTELSELRPIDPEGTLTRQYLLTLWPLARSAWRTLTASHAPSKFLATIRLHSSSDSPHSSMPHRT